MDSSIITALIVGVLALAGTIISAKFVNNVRVMKVEMKLDELERKVTKHNGLIDRMYTAEGRITYLEHCQKEHYEC